MKKPKQRAAPRKAFSVTITLHLRDDDLAKGRVEDALADFLYFSRQEIDMKPIGSLNFGGDVKARVDWRASTATWDGEASA